MCILVDSRNTRKADPSFTALVDRAIQAMCGVLGKSEDKYHGVHVVQVCVCASVCVSVCVHVCASVCDCVCMCACFINSYLFTGCNSS